MITRLLCRKADSGSLVTLKLSGNGASGRNRALRPWEVRVWASGSERVNRETGTPFWANKMPRVVPQVVAPMIAV